MIALIVLTGLEVFEMYESLSWFLEGAERPVDVERERWKEVRMLEKEREWKREVRILSWCCIEKDEQLRSVK